MVANAARASMNAEEMALEVLAEEEANNARNGEPIVDENGIP